MAAKRFFQKVRDWSNTANPCTIMVDKNAHSKALAAMKRDKRLR